MVGSVPRPIGWDTAQRSLEDGYERLQHRSDASLPAIPDLDPTPAVDVLTDGLDAVGKQLAEAGKKAAREQVGGIAEAIRREVGELSTEPTDDPVLARLRAWRPDRGT